MTIWYKLPNVSFQIRKIEGNRKQTHESGNAHTNFAWPPTYTCPEYLPNARTLQISHIHRTPPQTAQQEQGTNPHNPEQDANPRHHRTPTRTKARTNSAKRTRRPRTPHHRPHSPKTANNGGTEPKPPQTPQAPKKKPRHKDPPSARRKGNERDPERKPRKAQPPRNPTTATQARARAKTHEQATTRNPAATTPRRRARRTTTRQPATTQRPRRGRRATRHPAPPHNPRPRTTGETTRPPAQPHNPRPKTTGETTRHAPSNNPTTPTRKEERHEAAHSNAPTARDAKPPDPRHDDATRKKHQKPRLIRPNDAHTTCKNTMRHGKITKHQKNAATSKSNICSGSHLHEGGLCGWNTFLGAPPIGHQLPALPSIEQGEKQRPSRVGR